MYANICWTLIHNINSGVDPGFPIGGGTNHLGVPTCEFANFSKKQHEIENISGRRGACSGCTNAMGILPGTEYSISLT